MKAEIKGSGGPETGLTPVGKFEKYNPRLILNSIVRGAGKVFDRMFVPVFLMGIGASISYPSTMYLNLPTVVRLGLGAAAGFGLYLALSKTRQEEYAHPPKDQSHLP